MAVATSLLAHVYAPSQFRQNSFEIGDYGLYAFGFRLHAQQSLLEIGIERK
jgi:hypothetical protein